MNQKYNDTDFITGLRAVAICMVLLVHSGIGGIFQSQSYLSNIINEGRYGVHIFFVISGFTIFYQFMNSNYEFINFFKIRLLRILVPYLPILLGMFTLYNLNIISPNYWAKSLNNDEVSFINLFMHLSFFGISDNKYINSILGVEWSLYIEVFYYLMLGLAISIFDLRKKSVFIIIFIISVLTYLIMFNLHKTKVIDDLTYQWGPLPYFFMFMLGGLAYTIRYNFKHKSAKLSNLVLLLFMSQLALAQLQTEMIQDLMYPIATCLVIAFVKVDTLADKLLNFYPFQFIGRISFSLYLLHLPIIDYLWSIGLSRVNIFIMGLCLSILASYFYSKLFEEKLYGVLKNKVMRINIPINQAKIALQE